MLNYLTKASAPSKVHWTDECDRVFRNLKEAICTHPVLHTSYFEKPFHPADLDASGVYLDRETRYSTVEKECLALKWAINTLRYYLLGGRFFLVSDHRALQWLHCIRDANMHIIGWYVAPQSYDFTVHCSSGKSNVVADCLSRMSEEWGTVLFGERDEAVWWKYIITWVCTYGIIFWTENGYICTLITAPAL